MRAVAKVSLLEKLSSAAPRVMAKASLSETPSVAHLAAPKVIE